eukprot:m.443867 g.443867  ORF g.443867 m.443867 type:complete len:142 (-) comp19020_c0_seq1:1035-1460(-)
MLGMGCHLFGPSAELEHSLHTRNTIITRFFTLQPQWQTPNPAAAAPIISPSVACRSPAPRAFYSALPALPSTASPLARLAPGPPVLHQESTPCGGCKRFPILAAGLEPPASPAGALPPRRAAPAVTTPARATLWRTGARWR